ncbi:MAG: tetratricopeptide repeat protein [Ignavibacteria bacterium]|nr:tetratricopeptide repeat protein [Ignavibacteria bacterium]
MIKLTFYPDWEMRETEHLALFKLFFLLFLFNFNSFLHPQVYPESRVDSLLMASISHIIKQDYFAAEVFINSLNDEFPHLPLGKIYLAANKIAEAYDYAKRFDEAQITEYLEDAKEQAEKLLEKDEENLWYRYFYALSEGYISYFDAINGSWLSAVSTGVNSISEFEKILAIDRNFYEAYIAIGTFEYWRSRKTEFMNWMPFVNDTKKIGIERLEIASDSSSYNSYLAVNSLIWIYIDQKNYDAAIQTAKDALLNFPASRSFKLGMARAYEEIDSQTAIKLYEEILNSYPGWLNPNHINQITLKHLIAQQFLKLGKTEEALKICEEILIIKNLSDYSKEILGNRLERIKSLRDELKSGH